MALVVLAYAWVQKSLSCRPICRQLAIGGVFAIATVVSMLDPVVLIPNVPADLRMVMILLAGPFGGLPAVFICGVTALTFRFFEGGPGVLSGVVSILIALPVAMVFARRLTVQVHELTTRHFVTLGALCILSLGSVLVLPAGIRLPFLLGPAGPIVAATIAGVLLLGTLLTREARRLWAEEEVRRFALTDSLTHLPNRRALQSELARSFGLARRFGQPLSVLYLDIDRFKRVNDELGHDAGDAVLSGVANIIRSTIRQGDYAGRLGGEEFLLLLPNTSASGGAAHGERLLQTIERASLATPAGIVSITASIGVAAMNDQTESPDQLVRLADDALRLAKHTGRNRVVVTEEYLSLPSSLREVARLMQGDDKSGGQNGRTLDARVVGPQDEECAASRSGHSRHA